MIRPGASRDARGAHHECNRVNCQSCESRGHTEGVHPMGHMLTDDMWGYRTLTATKVSRSVFDLAPRHAKLEPNRQPHLERVHGDGNGPQ